MVDRIYGKKVNVEFQSIESLYNLRAKNSCNPINATMLQSDASDLPQRRNEYEAQIIAKNIICNEASSVLDIGCGAGRIRSILPRNIELYSGVDFSVEMLKIAKDSYGSFPNTEFINSDLKYLDLSWVEKKYTNLFLVATLIYLNDDNIVDLFSKICGVLKEDCTLYFRESLSITGERISLDKIYSKELGCEYSAIYRTREEYIQLYDVFFSKGFQLHSDILFPKKLMSHAETNLNYFILKRL